VEWLTIKEVKLFFWNKDKPHIYQTNSKFRETDPTNIDELIREHFPEINLAFNI
jgi:hypothetical protein